MSDELTLPQGSSQQAQTVEKTGQSVAKVIDGVREFSPPTHEDERGSLCELYSDSWGFDDIPMVHAYAVTVRPNQVKGWACHQTQVDRYFFFSGAVKLVLYDARPESPTYKLVTEKTYSDINRALVSVPPGVFHAVECVGPQEGLLFNIPSHTYNYEKPDKIICPIDTPDIPYTFKNSTGH
ncbi:dTDP-4-dehydrorhamnose 3,5-epimerase family protein [Ruegeria sp. 2012CJ41-6]|uniref:dTDP-4-dehydrorhamnose 3,5-epimerase n=1 Tax=Ruegeria spongiae TaxID=2942209 RepID=A0ABT0Q2F6_9RHOB|nr:dTDP-4-dehydrorhamnose 3,5-epimerase family protein [Ruegeria spongiae]MCL6283607.1 dTDP-4-dehydrorhamnose 3,5-epimerase family protein [Ruegeria spongiae]